MDQPLAGSWSLEGGEGPPSGPAAGLFLPPRPSQMDTGKCLHHIWPLPGGPVFSCTWPLSSNTDLTKM